MDKLFQGNVVNSPCIFREFSYLGLISLIFTAAGVFAKMYLLLHDCTVLSLQFSVAIPILGGQILFSILMQIF
jgi:hypothetical protein